MTINRLCTVAIFGLAAGAGCAAHASMIASDSHPVFGKGIAVEPVEVGTTVAEGQSTSAPLGRVRSAPGLEPARVASGERSSFFNEFISSALGPLGKSELASSIQSISASLKPYLESQGAYSVPSSSRELSRLNGENVVLAQDFSYSGVLTPAKSEVRTQNLEERTRNIDTMLVERGSASQANPIMQGVIDFFSKLLKNLASLFGD